MELLEVEGPRGHVPQSPIAGDATGFSRKVEVRRFSATKISERCLDDERPPFASERFLHRRTRPRNYALLCRYRKCPRASSVIYALQPLYALRAIIGSNQRFQSNVDPKKKSRPTNHFFLRKAKWSFVWYKNLDWFFFRFVTIHMFDGQTGGRTYGRTDRILIARPRLHSMQRDKKSASITQIAVKFACV